MQPAELTITQIHQGLKEKKFSCQELLTNVLEKIEEKDPSLYCYLTLNQKKAFQKAKRIDQQIAQNREISLLSGIPGAIKDNILVQSLKCTAGSKILKNYIAPFEATVIRKLKDEGSVILGKTNLDEFAMGSSCENSAFGNTRNPYDLKRVPGGSSGGSAAAVAANMATFSLGSDTGGSIRQPASFCGIVGFKPTYGAVSRYGLIAMASSLDQIGPLAQSVEDARIVFEAISGKDPLDSTSVESDFSVSHLKLSDLKIGVPQEYFGEGIDPAVKHKVQEAIKKIEQQGAKIEEISLPYCTDRALAAYYIIMPSEASTNLARYDGVKYGYSAAKNKSQKVDNLREMYLRTREEGFGDEVKRRIMIGTYCLSAGYYEAYYLRAQKVRTLIDQDFKEAFDKIDLILTPSTPTPPFKIGEKVEDPVSMYLSDILMVAVNLAGLPALSVPCGKVNNLPVGLQIIGNSFKDEEVLMQGQKIEKIIQ